MDLRPYQQDLIRAVYKEWNAGARNVAAILPTGGGKTVCFGTILRNHVGASCAIAHRRELVGQMSLTLARLGVRHRIIAPSGTIREIVTRHMYDLGQSFYNANAHCAVAGIDTLCRREPDHWSEQVSLWVLDETHHLIRGNKWGRGVSLFPNARGLGVTATFCRSDGKGLGRQSDGLMDVFVEGPTGRWLIENDFLSDYRIFAPPSDFDRNSVPVSESTGDFSLPALREATHRSHIVGDIVDHYLKIAPMKLGLTFCASVELAAETAAKFRSAGVPAEVVTAETPELTRAETMRRFFRGEIKQLCNVDLFGEGFDVPAVEVVSMGRATQSYGLYAQQFGRALRPMEGKDRAIIIDHVGNVLAHGLPDLPKTWTLERRDRKSRGKADDAVPVRVCPACTGVYERFYKACPYCGHTPEPASRSTPQQVDGDLHELDPAVLAQLRGEIARIDGPVKIPMNVSGPAGSAISRVHRERQQAQSELREVMAWWAGWQKSLGRADDEAYRRFFFGFGVDAATAQTLGTKDAEELAGRIRRVLDTEGVKIDV